MRGFALWRMNEFTYDSSQPMRAAVPPANAGRRAASQCVTNDGSSLYTIGYCSVTLPINKMKGRVSATRPDFRRYIS